MFLETPRLVLRRFTDDDFSDFYAFAADREMCRMMGRDDLTDPDAARRNFLYLKNIAPRAYAIVLKDSGAVIGNLTVGEPSSLLRGRPELAGKRGCSLSFSISRHYRRLGLMSEAVRAVIDRLFSEESFDYINCGFFSFNEASQALQEKLGFRFLLRDTIRIDGEEIEVIENILWRRI
ncbi:MAG: GNAT family N-acetyltransferase [Eubacteriales bacterium]|nr:GNAT family N-acetyltransferase [Eubacteriales bacterium]